MYWKTKSAFLLALVIFLPLLISGCSTVGKAFNLESKVVFNFEVWPDVNPDDTGRASPIVVSVFELEDARQFSQEDFIHLYESPEKYLGKDLIKHRRLKEFAPGYDRIEELVADPKTRYIGVLAEFVQYDRSQGRVVFEIKPHQKTRLNIRLSKRSIQFITPKSKDTVSDEGV